MSQVKNLRAMFENKGDTSPPDRGRSPGVSMSVSNPAGIHGSESPRPLSKVRTNFVAVEKDGRMGLRRDPSGESSLSRRRLSIETDAESTSTFPDRPAVASDDDLTKPMRKLFISEPIPESPRQPVDANHLFEEAGAVSDKPSTDPGKRLSDEQPVAAPTHVSSTTKTSSEGTKAKGTIAVSSSGVRKGDKIQARTSAAQPTTTVTMSKKSGATSTTAAKPTAKPTAKVSAANKSSSGAPKKPDAKLAKVSEKPAPRRETAAATTKPATAAAKPKPMSSTTANKPGPLKIAGHSGTGFVKPKPKSPTKPVHLPSSLTAPTASSVSKGGAPRQSLSRQSGSLQHPSVSTNSSTLETPSTTSTLTQHNKRQGSAIGRPRPSVGPPPSKPSQPVASAAKRQSHVDEGFLARMMRPTQSSSSKTTDKGPPTPPKKTAPRPSTSATVRSLQQEAGPRKSAGPNDTPVTKPRAPSSQSVEAARTPENVSGETANTKAATESAASPFQGSGEAPMTVIPRNLDTAPEPEQANDSPAETTQIKSDAEVAAVVHHPELAETSVEHRAPISAHELVSVELTDVELAPTKTAEDTVALAQDDDLIQTPKKPDVTPQFDSVLIDEPAPEVAHTEGIEEKNETCNEGIRHSHASPVEPAFEVVKTDPADNVERKNDDAVHEATEESLAEPVDAASEDLSVVSVEEDKYKPGPTSDLTADTESLQGVDGLDDGSHSGSEQKAKAAGGRDGGAIAITSNGTGEQVI